MEGVRALGPTGKGQSKLVDSLVVSRPHLVQPGAPEDRFVPVCTEGESYRLPSDRDYTVRYGINGCFVLRTFPAGANITAENSAFSDPAPGFCKVLEVEF